MLTVEQKMLLEEKIYGIVKQYLTEKKGKKISNTKWSNIRDNAKRKALLNWLKSDTVNKAAIAYELYHAENDADKAAARSLFYKKLYNEKNDNGVPYEFSAGELNTIAAIKSNKNGKR